MKALVLAGGQGTRLRPLSHTTAKQLVPIGGRPVLFHCLDAIKDADITDVGIVVGGHAAEIEEAVGDGSAFGLSVTYIPQEKPLGLAHCVHISREFLGEDDFVMFLGDNVVEEGITDLVEQFRETRPAALLLVDKVPDPSAYGVVEIDPSGEVLRLEEKASHPRSNLAIIGVYVFSSAVHDAVRAIEPSARGELEITDAVQWLVDQGRSVKSHTLDGYWKDTGQIDDLLDCNRIVLEGIEPGVHGEVDAESWVDHRARVEAGARVIRSRIVGPVLIGADTVVQDSYVGPFTAVGADCVLENTYLEFSIVMDGVSITQVHGVRDSVIGRHARVRRVGTVPSGHRLVIGDHSTVSVQP